MVATLEILIAGRDHISSMLGKVNVSFASLAKAGIAAGLGIHGVEGALQGAKRVLTASIGAASAYEHQMAQIRALTGATRADTDQLSDSIMDMTKELPKSPAELGAGAYFILSSGITDAGDAAKVLNIAAKASVVGLGETQVVADALTTVLNAYGKTAGDASQVTDVLIQAVKEGKVEGTGFAAVLGRVVPIASQMGISFEEVGANLATFTRLGVGAEEAAVGLRGVLNALLDPSEQAKTLLAGVGLSMDEIRSQIKERGLAAVLQDLMGLFGGNAEALSDLFPEVRGLTNVLATAGVQADAYTQILANMGTATGNLDRGFEDVSQTTKFKVDKAMNDLNVNLMLMGEELLPLVADSMAVLTEGMVLFTGAIKGADDGLNTFGLKLVDVINLKGGLAGKGITELVGLTDNLGGRFRILGGSAGEAGEDIEDFATKTPDAILGTVALGKTAAEVAADMGDLGAAVVETDTKVSDFFKDFQSLARDAIQEFLPLAEEFSMLADTTADNAEATGRLSDLQDRLADTLNDSAASAAKWREELQDQLVDALSDADDATVKWNEHLAELQDQLVDATTDYTDALAEWNRETRDMELEIRQLKEELAEKLAAGDDPLGAEEIRNKIADLMAELARGPKKVEELQDKINDLNKEMAKGPEKAHELQERINELNAEIARGPSESVLLTDSISDLRDEIAKANADIPAVVSGFDAWRKRVSDTAADYVAFRDNMKLIMDALVGQHVVGVADIMAVVQTQGPTFAANFAQWFRDDPIAAATTVREIMPGIMGEAAQTAIANVLAETSKFNAAWQRDVIDVLNTLPEEKKLAITTTVDPQWWLLVAQLTAMEPGLNIPWTVESAHQGGQMPGAPGMPGGQHGAFIPPGVVTPMMLHGGTRGEIVAPLDKMLGGQTFDYDRFAMAACSWAVGMEVVLDGRIVGYLDNHRRDNMRRGR